jgi:hypothetical protein
VQPAVPPPPRRSDRAPLPTAALRSWLTLATLALAIGGLATQAVAIATGRDFVFGAIPKLNPGGTGNLPVWLGSVTLAVGAGAAAWLAVAFRAHRRGSPWAWWLLSGLLTLLSLERMAMASAHLGLGRAHGLTLDAPVYVGWAVMSLLALPVLFLAVRDLPRETRRGLTSALTLLALGAVVATTAGVPNLTVAFADRANQAVAMTAARVLELGGVTLFTVALLNHAATHVRVATLRFDSHLPPGVWLAHGDDLEVRLSPRRVGRLLAVAVGVVLAASLIASIVQLWLGGEASDVWPLLDVDLESNLPTWFSSLLLMSCAGAAALIAGLSRDDAAVARRWAVLAVLFVALSADEAAGFHELLVFPLRVLVRQSPWLRYPLILPGILALVAGWLALGSFVRAMPSATRRRLGWGLVLFAGGALGVETIGGWFDPVVHGESLTYAVFATLEEGLEMSGVVVAFVGLLEHIEHHAGPITFPDPA